MKKKDYSSRYHIIDAVRAAALINMIAYHLCYDIFEVFSVHPNWYLTQGAIVWERFICCTFIIVSGISMNFSRRPYKRGILVNLCELVITSVTLIIMPSQAIIFGILNLIGCSMLLTALIKPLLEKLHPCIGTALFFLLFSFTYGLPQRYLGFFKIRLIRLPEFLYQWQILSFFGFKPNDFFSSDYFPLLPWIFLFIMGYFLWKVFERYHIEKYFRPYVPVLTPIGRHSLLLYMAHQPVLYGICYVVFEFIIKQGR